jgi:integrase
MPKIKGVYKRGNIWWIRYAGPDGRMRFESTGGASHREAQVMLLQRKQEVLEGKDPVAKRKISKYLFSQLAEQYIIWAEDQKSYRSKRYLIIKLVEHFGNIPLDKFTFLAVEQYRTTLKREGRSVATANRYLTVIKHMFTKAVEWEMVDKTAHERIRKVKAYKENNTRLRFLSQKECERLIKACPDHLRPIVITALNTGMRLTEILTLRWGLNVDLQHGFILLENTKNGERREIPINWTLRETLDNIPNKKRGDRVFRYKGRSIISVKKSFITAMNKAKITDFKFHDLRHTFASHMIMAGVDITTVKELLGHKTLDMTMRYAHLAPSHKVNALHKLDKKLNRKPTIQKLYNIEGKEKTINAEKPTNTNHAPVAQQDRAAVS